MIVTGQKTRQRNSGGHRHSTQSISFSVGGIAGFAGTVVRVAVYYDVDTRGDCLDDQGYYRLGGGTCRY